MNYEIKCVIIATAIGLVGCAAPTKQISTLLATSPVEGTYIGASNRKVNLSSFENSGTYQYGLIFVGDGIIQKYKSSEPKQIKQNQLVTFKQTGSAYHGDAPSQCNIDAIVRDGKLQVSPSGLCSTDEKNMKGDYAYSKAASIIPEQYRGKWDVTSKCDVPAMIEQSWLTSDTDYGAAEVIATNKTTPGGLEIIGIEEYEDTVSRSNFILALNGNRLKLRGEHHTVKFNKLLMRCQ